MSPLKGPQQAAVVGLVIGLVFAGLQAYTWISPIKPKITELKAKTQETEYIVQIANGRKKITELRDANAKRIYEMPAEEVGPKLMARVSAMARNRNLKINSFRPGRTEDRAGLVATPYSMTITGAFPNVVRLAQDLETPELKLAVNNLQIAAADGETDAVNASIGVTVFRDASAKKEVSLETTPESAKPKPTTTTPSKQPNGSP